MNKLQLLSHFSFAASAPLKRSFLGNVYNNASRLITVGQKIAPEKPKKAPPTGYQLFMKERTLGKQQGENQENPRDRFKRLAAEWNDLSEERKDIYRARYAINLLEAITQPLVKYIGINVKNGTAKGKSKLPMHIYFI